MIDPTPLAETTPAQRAAASVAALALAAVHLVAGRLRFLDVVPRSRLLSLSGGASVAYVFVHALPELEAAGVVLDRRITALAFVEEHAYLVALLGFVTFYGLERFVRGRSPEGARETSGVFWLHVGSFLVYNGLVGYLLFHQEAPGIGSLAIFALALGLHFLVNDYGLRHLHGAAYRRYGRWLLAGAVIAGGLLGALTAIDRAMLGALFAFLSGGIVLNVIKEELPPERESRFSAFALGAGAYAALLILV